MLYIVYENIQIILVTFVDTLGRAKKVIFIAMLFYVPRKIA